ncbi:hypothetical protein M427DRAFT_50920 [Gonapodya prolifera JEL478]|uniref:Xylanolytic transcriptional activator regulatory domain-containing protein n=1 Tax=Gonapodya prolifera (strain JEL478) TaxID=1344416 RepID=A0A139AYF1_GONPJ|nr:hypothetical protein M427DRAFT_50920 [Gonapodya prolifera JEL478]|eukprot:KXS21485.1 hypothetical protein M427DRAFT_50920 [Gonapodya prolifera JEL478]
MVLLALQAASSRFLPSWSCPQSHQVACYERAKRVVVPYLAGGGRASLGALQAMLFVFVFASTGEGQHAVDVVVRWMALIVQVAREMGINEDPEDGDVDGEGEGGRNRRDSNGDWRVDEMRRRTWWAIFLLGVSIPILAGIPPIVFAHECADLRIMQPIHVYDKAPHTDSSTGPPPAPPARPTFRTLIESPLPDLDDWSSVTLYQFYLLHLCGHAHADLSMPDTPDQRAQRIQCIESKLSILEVSLLALDAPRAGFGEGFGGTWKHLLLALSWVLLHLPVRASIERVMGMSPKQASGKDKEALARWVRSDSGATCERKGGDFVALLEHVMSVTGGMGDREYGGWLDLGFPVVDWGCFFIGMIHLAMATCPSPDPGRISARECIRRATVCLAALRMSGKVWLDMKVFAAGLEGMCSHVETLVPADQAATLPSATLTHMVGGADHTIPLGWGVPTARNVEASFEDVLAEVTDTSPSSDGWI